MSNACICDGWPGNYEGARRDCPEHGDLDTVVANARALAAAAFMDNDFMLYYTLDRLSEAVYLLRTELDEIKSISPAVNPRLYAELTLLRIWKTDYDKEKRHDVHQQTQRADR